VRTTLKRGAVHTAAANGDRGDGFVPETLSAMRRYRQPPTRTGLGLVGRILLLIVAAVVMLAAALAGGAWLYFDQTVEAVQAHSKSVIQSQPFLTKPGSPNSPTTALLLGYDRRFKETDPGRSDTLMLLRADPTTNSMSLLSFPRDLVVPIYCPGQSVRLDRINTAYAYCNVKGTILTLKHLTGLKINYVITVNFRYFRQVVNRVGGVWIDVDHRYFNRNLHTLETNYAAINLQPGYQLLHGSQALAFARFRHTDSDFHRIARQQEFVKALKERIGQASWTDRFGLLGALTKNLEVGKGGGGDISRTDILKYAYFAYKLPPGHFFQPKLNGITGTNELRASQPEINAAVNEFLHPDINSSERATESILGVRKHKGPHVSAHAVTVSVLNGNHVPGSAASARAQLRQRGFHTIEPVNPLAANAPSQYWRTVIYFDPNKKLARAGALKLQSTFGDAKVVKGIPPTLTKLALNAMTVAVVGKTFHNLGPAPSTKIPKRQPPNVRLDPGATRGLLRKAQRRVDFRLEVPRYIEASSQPDFPVSYAPHDIPIRTYSMNHHKAVRLIFRMADGWDYWGIEETNWNNPPILDKPNATRYIHGRRFDLYFAGSTLHQIVLRENGATYWVENSIRNDLSNETMLAIAKGLRPLKRR
jgi:LCP family protein required for cell wall assembly